MILMFYIKECYIGIFIVHPYSHGKLIRPGPKKQPGGEMSQNKFSDQVHHMGVRPPKK